MRLSSFVFVALAAFALVGHANMYNDWAQKNAVNLMCGINPICSMGKALIPSKERISKMTTAINRDSKVLSRPNVGLISSAEILNYPYVNRYLTELDDKDISHYYILREDYTFQDLSGESITIPAGFIWDGASIPTVAEMALEVGNTRYNSALAEGLIHDYMYRDPRRFSKEDADDLLYVNLVRCGNADPIAIYEGVHVAGGDSYQGHKKRQDQGLYDVFTPEFYKENMKTFQDENKRSDAIDTSKLEALLKEQIVFDLSLLQKGQQKGEKATDSEIANHNSRNDKIFQEIVSICKKIDAFKMSDEEKVQKLKDTITPIVDKYAAESKSIIQKLVDNKIVDGLQSPSFDPKGLDIGFLNNDTVKAAQDSSSKKSTASQERTMTDEDAINLLREDGSGIKAAADALKE